MCRDDKTHLTSVLFHAHQDLKSAARSIPLMEEEEEKKARWRMGKPRKLKSRLSLGQVESWMSVLGERKTFVLCDYNHRNDVTGYY
ncbi:hypothetical protein AVEN_231295-1 [Araneus ventricosus]|uniref:Uncharacterized protein n=1 Tax=Araneus ventricosus TaxID=182803 RepID=A0A4Y2CI12_ARAVE|nr:hypothetical protein AVEN_231295-1 [Araneus ventricosus]